MAKVKPEVELELDVIALVSEEKELESKQAELMQNPEFANFVQSQKAFQEKSKLMWDLVFQQMDKHNIKSIKGDWGSVTLAQKMGFDINMDELPAKFIKKVADVKKIGDTYKLSGKLPKGTQVKYTKYLTKRIKSGEIE